MKNMKNKTKLLLISIALGLGMMVGIVTLMSRPPSTPAGISTFFAMKDSLRIPASRNWWKHMVFWLKARKQLDLLREKPEWSEADSLLLQQLDRQLNQRIHD